METINKKNVAKKVNQFTLGNLSTERAYIIGKGWENIKIDEEFKSESFDKIVNLLGGREKTKKAILFTLKNTPVHGWFADRIVFEPLRDKWVYIPGQDMPYELQQIRNILKK